MELKQIKDLMAAMGRTGTKKITIEKEDFKLTIEHEGSGDIRYTDQSLDLLSEDSIKQAQIWARTDQALSRGSEMPAGRISSPIALENDKEDVNSTYVTSPMVGTFYTAPSPEDSPFVKVGDKVDKNTVVCIVEAMKVLNEIKANMTGVVAEILVETGHPVEFGTKLFRIVE